MAEHSGAGSQEPPSSPPTELLLSRRLAQVTRERDDLAAELAQLKAERASFVQIPRSSNDPPAPSTPATPPATLTIPPDILPTLSLLRDHITNLTRDNDALRYTFLGSLPTTSAAGTAGTARQPPQVSTAQAQAQSHRVDLEAVLKRVKELVKENEELGEMVLEAGRTRLEGWQSALNDSKQVITSLDADLEHHLGVIRTLQAELARYKLHFGPLPGLDDGASPSKTESRSSDRSERRKPEAGARRDVAGGRETAGESKERVDWDRDRDKGRMGRNDDARGRGRGRGGRPSRGGAGASARGSSKSANGGRVDS